MQQAVAYYRVSTQQQGKSGLGLEAQQATVERFAAAEGYTLAQAFIEIESGSDDARPELPPHERCTRCSKGAGRQARRLASRCGCRKG